MKRILDLGRDPVKVSALEDTGLRLGFAATVVTRRNTQLAMYAGHTWASFKAAVESLGVRDEDVIASVEFGVSQVGTGYLQKDYDEFGGLELREVSK